MATNAFGLELSNSMDVGSKKERVLYGSGKTRDHADSKLVAAAVPAAVKSVSAREPGVNLEDGDSRMWIVSWV